MLDNITLRLNEIKFHNSIMKSLKQKDVSQLQVQLNTLLKIIDHPAPIAISNAWMKVVSGELAPVHDELVILLNKQGMSKNAIRKLLKMSPNTVLNILRDYEDDPYPIEPKLDRDTSEYVTMFVQGIEEYIDAWKGDLI